MALWKELPQKEELAREPGKSDGGMARLDPISRPKSIVKDDSVIGAGLTIEGKIEGAGHVRIVGRFKGDVQVDGDVTIEQGAHISGEVKAENVIVAGEVQGNIEASSRVEFLQSGVLIGDLKAGSLTVAAGSRMRGKVEFGWDERDAHRLSSREGDGSAL